MLKEHSMMVKVLVVVVDAGLLAGAFVAAFYWRSLQGCLEPMSKYMLLLYFSVPVTLVTFYSMKLYDQLRYLTLFDICYKTAVSLIISGVLSSSVLFLAHASYFSRLLFAYYFLLGSLLLTLEKIVLKLLQNYFRSRGYNTRDLLLIGSGGKLERLVEVVMANPVWGLNIRTIVDISMNRVSERVRNILRNEVVDEVFIAFSRDAAGNIDIGTILGIAEEFGKTIKVFVNLDEELNYSRIDLCHFAGMPALVFYSKTIDPDLMLLKRGIDIMGAMAGLCITMVFFPFVAIAIKLDSPGPVFFAQTRIGLNGRKIRVYKFRSMYSDAEDHKQELMARNEIQGPIFKMEHDPRITRVGYFLRSTSLDEFPQFWNVLKGDMSLVGTRPPTPDEVRRYSAWHYRRISIRPGITGLWQVSGRNRIRKFDDIVALDLEYISSWSIWLDCRILFRTVLLLLGLGKGGAM